MSLFLKIEIHFFSFALVIDRYYFHRKYSPLVLCAICCSYISVILSMIPKQCFQTNQNSRMKQAFALLNKDSNLGQITTTFEEIRAQRRLRNALLYNEIKT